MSSLVTWRRLRSRLVLVVAVATATMLLAGAGQAATEDLHPTRSGPPPVTRAAGDTTVVKTVRVRWNGNGGQKRYTRAAVVPGIGNVKLVCRPDTTIVKLYADKRSAETQMWLAKHEVKNDRNVVAVKNVRIYTYANANDDGRGGTGPSSHEGLNQQTPVENYSRGYAHGIISQRPGRHQPAGSAALTPVTSFTLDWYWNGFHHPASYQSCKVKMVLTTVLDERIGLNWHGDDDAVGNTVRTTSVAGLGDLQLTCETGRNGVRSVSLAPLSEDADVWVEYVTGEGAVDDHVETFELGYDEVTGLVGPLELPRNGMMRLYYTVDGVTQSFIVSSYLVTNNLAHPELNLCEVAVARF